MANFLRIVGLRVVTRLAVVAVLALIAFSISGHAAASFTQPTGNTCDGQACETWCSSSTFAAEMTSLGYPVSFVDVVYAGSTASCRWTGDATGNVPSEWVGSYHLYHPAFIATAVTPSNSTCEGGSCTCDSGYLTNGTNDGCVAGPSCAQGSNYSSGYYSIGSSPTGIPQTVGCDGNCGTVFVGSSPESRRLVNGVYQYFAKGAYERDGTTCETGSAPVSPAVASALTVEPTPTCGADQTLLTVSGASVCVTTSTGLPVNPNAASTATENSTVSTVTNQDGSTTTTTTRTVNAPGGGGQINEVTTVNKDAAGVITGGSITSTAPADPLKDFCKDNPQAPLCSKSNFGGACGAFVCQGDAAACAIARATSEIECQVKERTAQTTLGEQLQAGADPLAATLPTSANASIVNVPSSLITTGWLGGSCPPDRVIPFGSNSLTIPLSQLCNAFETLGAMLLVVAMLGAARIVGVWG